MDFMVGSLNATQMLARADYLELGQYAICVAVPHSYPLAQRSGLVPEDLHGEKLIIVQNGDTRELDRLRQWILEKHPQIQSISPCSTSFFFSSQSMPTKDTAYPSRPKDSLAKSTSTPAGLPFSSV